MGLLNYYEEKKEALLCKIKEYTVQDVVIAFSGGVDSSLLLKLACESAEPRQKKVYAVTIESELHPRQDMEIAKKVAKEAGAIHKRISICELQEAGIQDNPKERCYLCKKYLFEKLKEFAETLHISTVIEGTNEDDLHVYRPGIRAVRELGIISPLAEVEMTKEEVRRMAAEYGISVADRPSAPCLATRFPYGTALTFYDLELVEKGEVYIRAVGFRNVRMRVHKDVVRIEVDKEDVPKLVLKSDEIISYLKTLGYRYITVDLEGFRSGSMDSFVKT